VIPGDIDPGYEWHRELTEDYPASFRLTRPDPGPAHDTDTEPEAGE
jgi:hypothetical protein